MHRTLKIKITELNPQLICVLCGGYLVDASTIVECLHSFCKTCIARYLDNSKCCPICDTMVHKTKPMQNVRLDKTLQDLVYKLVPGLYKNEMKRRREFYSAYPIDPDHPPGLSEDRGNEDHDRIIYTEDEKISLELELFAGFYPSKHFKSPSSDDNDPDTLKEKDTRYLLCPAGVCVGHLKKFVRLKFDIPCKYKIDVYHSDEPLKDYLTLMDIAYIYTWRRNSPLKLIYSIYEVTGTKRTASDDESVTETSKHPRLSSDTEETDAYSESESQDGISQDDVTKKDSNENHILQNTGDSKMTDDKNSDEENKTINRLYEDNDLPVDLSNYKSKKSSFDIKTNKVGKETNGFIGHHFLQKAYTVNRKSANDFSFKPKKKYRKHNSTKQTGLLSPLNGIVRSEYDFNE